jgi:4,5-dihydroxyphthalate decarboxylase
MKITVSLVPSPLTTPVLDGTVAVPGAEVVANTAKSVDDNSRRMLDGAFDVAEMSLATFVRARDQGAALVGLPVFPGRRFVQAGVLRRPGAGIESPSDLAGRRVALPQYWLTSSVWHRGVLKHEFGVAPETIEWITAVAERGSARFPAGVRVTHREGMTVLDLLKAGAADAALVPRVAAVDLAKSGADCVFQSPAAAQRAYLEKTGIFPIMHFIVARKPLIEEAPRLAGALYAAFEAAKRGALADPARRAALEPPFHGMTVADSLPAFGGDAWPYGLVPNRPAIDAFLTYAYEQGLIGARHSPDDILLPLA